MAKRLTEEELRKGAVAFRGPVTPGMAKAAAPRPKPIKAGSADAAAQTHTTPRGEGVAVAGIAPPMPAAPGPVAETEHNPGGTTRRKGRPGPAPAAVAAEAGAGGGAAPSRPVDSVSRETPPQPDVPPHLDLPAFKYREQVEAMERMAMSQGRTEDAARIRGEYNKLIDGQFRYIESEYKAKTLPQVQAMQQELLKFQGRQLPRELAIKARDTVMQAGQQQQQMLAFLYGLVRNDSTKGLGIKYFNDSELIEPGVQLADLVVDEKTGMLIGVDASGATVRMSSGQELVFPVEAAEQLYQRFYEGSKDQTVKLGKGDILVDRQGRQIAANPEGQYATADDRLSAIKVGTAALARRLGIELDATGRLMEGVDDQTRQRWLELSAEVERAVLAGTPPQQAAEAVWRNAGAAAPAAAAPPNVPRPWAPSP